jgi:hypothetical protein
MLECGVEVYGDGQSEKVIEQLPDFEGGETVVTNQVDAAFGGLTVTVPYIGWEVVG